MYGHMQARSHTHRGWVFMMMMIIILVFNHCQAHTQSIGFLKSKSTIAKHTHRGWVFYDDDDEIKCSKYIIYTFFIFLFVFCIVLWISIQTFLPNFQGSCWWWWWWEEPWDPYYLTQPHTKQNLKNHFI